MTWNYRIVAFKANACRNRRFYKLQEVFYDSKGKPWSCGDGTIAGESLKECFEELLPILTGMGRAYLKYPEDFTGKAPGTPRKRTAAKTRKIP